MFTASNRLLLRCCLRHPPPGGGRGGRVAVTDPRPTRHRRPLSSTSAGTPSAAGIGADGMGAGAVAPSGGDCDGGRGLEDDELKRNPRPSDVVRELDRHIVGQADAKRAVAIALRNRWRRKRLPGDLRGEVTPRNVLMIGPTGCGKTEVARRMAELGGAPFLKVEATKFTEVGYHGRDVDQIIRDLVDVSISLTRKQRTDMVRADAERLVEERILDLLIGPEMRGGRDRASLKEALRDGLLEEQEVEVDVPTNQENNDNSNMFRSSENADPETDKKMPQVISISLGGMAGGMGNASKTQRKRMTIAEARGVILDLEIGRLLEGVDIKKEAVAAVEESGIVFIDEIDKICTSREAPRRGGDASDEGVQRDLLPIVEGTTISTKHGNVNTDYILFVASGAFHAVKPSDMLPELQGRLPIRVELQGLTEEDLYRILTEPVANLLRQQIELLATEGVTLIFEEDAIREVARMAALVNRTVENIGARRLHTIIERIMEELSFDAAEMDRGSSLTVDKALVEGRLADVAVSHDLSRYIL